MAKTRMVNTRFWSDNFVRENLNPLDRYLFLYFLTNDKTNIAGIYELPLSIITSETGIEKDMLLKMFKRLKGKIDYFDGWVIIRNFQKYQNIKSQDVLKGIEREKNELPNRIKEFIEKPTPSRDGLGRVYRRPEEPNLTKPNLTKRPTADMSAYADAFNQFWLNYPKKELKKKTYQIWINKKLDNQLTKIIDFIEKAKLTDRWCKGYIKQPTAFLNGECWNDDLTAYGDKKEIINIKTYK